MGLPTGWLTAVSSEDQETAIAAASSLADSYLSARYTLPLSEWGYDLRRVVCHIASWDLLSRRGFDPENAADKAIRMRYDDAIKWLADVRDGKNTPTDIVDATPEVEDSGPHIVTTTRRGWRR